MGLDLTTPPVLEPITTAQAKTHLRVDAPDDDTYIDELILAAREYVEVFQRRQLITATWVLRMDAFPHWGGMISIPKPPLQSITSIQYVDTSETTQTFAASKYNVDTTSIVGRVALADGEVWPDAFNEIDVVIITFVAGYGTAGTDVPESTRLAIKQLVANWYEQREPVVVGTITSKLPLNVEDLINYDRVLEVV